MYAIYRTLVYEAAHDSSARQLDSRVTRTLGLGTHRVRVRHVDVGLTHARFWLVNQFDETHTEPVLLRDGDSRISWNLWRCLVAFIQDRSEVYRARAHVLANPNILTALSGAEVEVHIVPGPGYRVVRGASNRYWIELLPDGRVLESVGSFPAHDDAAAAAEMEGYSASTYQVGGWKSVGNPVTLGVSDNG